MKNKTIFKVLCIVLAMTLLCSCGARSESLDGKSASDNSTGVTGQDTSTAKSDSQPIKMTSEDITWHFYNMDTENADDVTTYFKNGNRQIPYIDLDTMRELMIILNNTDDITVPLETPTYNLTITTDGPIAVVTRENGYPMTIDFDKDTITFLDYDKFMLAPYKITILDILYDSGYDKEGKPSLFQRVKEDSYDRYGKEWTLDMAKYGIDLIYVDGQYYFPLQTVADIFLQGYFVLYNNKEIFITSSGEASSFRYGESSPILERYYEASMEKRSQELIDYTYNELCFVMDTFYGLKDTHNISTFDELFECLEVKGLSMKEMMLSQNPRDFDIALAQLMLRDLDDNHSSYYLPGAYTGNDASVYDEIQYGISNREYDTLSAIYSAARQKQYPDGVPGYEEVGNTAYITFDEFFTREGTDLYTDFPTSDAKDTISLLVYAHSRIMREGSPIKNVVIDLSINGGGECDAAVFVCAWFLGETPLYVSNPNTGASSCTAYRCDVNLDREFNEKDTLEGKNLYCLISPLSFSCGNLTPNVFAASHRVTLLGQTSGGGSCCVLSLTTANGSMFRTSSSNSISIIKNGAYYDVDQGISPDFVLSNPDSYYNRAKLTQYINSLH